MENHRCHRLDFLFTLSVALAYIGLYALYRSDNLPPYSTAAAIVLMVVLSLISYLHRKTV